MALQIISIVAGIAGILSILLQIYGELDNRRWRIRAEDFDSARAQLRDKYCEIAGQALAAHAKSDKPYDSLPVLAKPGWLLDPPVELDAFHIEWTDDPPADDGFKAAREHWSRIWPRDANTSRIRSYHEAITKLGAPRLWWDSPVYRLVAAELDDKAQLTLKFTLGRYFGAIDTQEVLTFDAARRHVKGELVGGAYSWLTEKGGPFRVANRCASAAIVALTLVTDRGRTQFLLHRRDPNLVVNGGDTLFAVPAGEFEPANARQDPLKPPRDFSLWRCLMREYAEEFLGQEDYHGSNSPQPDYENHSPFRELQAGVVSGTIRPWCLGLAINPLSCRPEILAAVVFDRTAFEEIFFPLAASIPPDSEGQKHVCEFTAEGIAEVADDPDLQPVARALVRKAWAGRAVLVG